MKILVTGATGYAGAHIAPALRRAGHTVLGLTRRPDSSRARALAAAEIRVVAGDLGDPAGYRPHLEEVDAVVHLVLDVADPTGSDRALFTELEAAEQRDGRRRHLVYTTGCSSYGKVAAPVLDETTPGNPDNPLHFRFELEAELARRGLPHTVLRPGFLYGADARTSMSGRWFAEGAAGKAVFHGDPTKAWTWVHVDDLAQAYAAVVDHVERGGGAVDGQVFCIGEETPATALDVLVACARAAGHTGGIDERPIDEATWLDQAADQDEIMTSAKARERLGWVPRRTGVIDDVDAYHAAWRAAQASA